MKHFIPFVCIVAVLFAACKNGEPELKLKVEPSVITCPDTGGDYEVELTSANAWTADVSESWIKLTPASGDAGTSTVRIKISANKESAESAGKITFTDGANTTELPVTRAAKAPAQLSVVSETEINAPRDGGEYTIQVESNIRWSASSNVSWAKVSKGVSQNNDNVTITVSAATIPEETTAVITIAPYGEGKEAGEQTVTITRGGTDATSMSVDPTKIDASSDGGNYTVNVSTTAKWRAWTTWDVDWFKLSNTEGEGDGTFGVTIDPATSTGDMTGIITIEEVRTDNYKPVVSQVTVTRKGKAAASLSVTPTKIDAPAAGGEFPVTIKSNYPWTASVVGAKYFSISINKGDGDATMIVTVKPTTEEQEATGSVTIRSTFGGEEARVNIRRAAAIPVAPEPDEEPATKFTTKPFSVNSSDGKVYFSSGNLQYQASTDTWRFALRQWSVVGEYNKYISDTYSGWIDLFGYGTGLHPTWSYSDTWRYPGFADWGVNAISNGGSERNQWRTLTEQEFRYMLGMRDNWNKLRGYGTVNDVPGFILLPDDWHLPASLTFNANEDNSNAKYSDNVYSGEQWQKMETAGAVFLPVGGSRIGTAIHNKLTDKRGFYWVAPNQADEESSKGVYMFAFWEGYKYRVDKDSHPESGLSVRLVYDVK